MSFASDFSVLTITLAGASFWPVMAQPPGEGGGLGPAGALTLPAASAGDASLGGAAQAHAPRSGLRMAVDSSRAPVVGTASAPDHRLTAEQRQQLREQLRNAYKPVTHSPARMAQPLPAPHN